MPKSFTFGFHCHKKQVAVKYLLESLIKLMDHSTSESAPLVHNLPSHSLRRFKYVICFAIALSSLVVLLIILGATGTFGGGSYKFMYSSYYSSDFVTPYYPAIFDLETDGQWHAVGWSNDMEYQYISGQHSSKLVLNLRCVGACTSNS